MNACSQLTSYILPHNLGKIECPSNFTLFKTAILIGRLTTAFTFTSGSNIADVIILVILFVVAANSVPFLTVSGNGSLTGQWTVLEQNSITFSTSDADGDTVTMHGWMPLPSGSSLSQVNSGSWQFEWTPTNMDPVELV